MIPLNQEQHLGKKAYLYFAIRKMLPGLILILAAIILLVVTGPIGALITYVFDLFGQSGVATADSVTNVVYALAIGIVFLALLTMITSISAARLQYKNYSFTFEEFGLKMKRGMMKTIEISIPYRQMQNVNVERNGWHQLTNTSKLIINTASNEEEDEKNETDIVLNPIDKYLGEEVRLMLQRKIGVQVVETEKEADEQAVKESVISTPQ